MPIVIICINPRKWYQQCCICLYCGRFIRCCIIGACSFAWALMGYSDCSPTPSWISCLTVLFILLSGSLFSCTRYLQSLVIFLGTHLNECTRRRLIFNRPRRDVRREADWVNYGVSWRMEKKHWHVLVCQIRDVFQQTL